MSIVRKPVASRASEQEIEALINKGGTAPTSSHQRPGKRARGRPKGADSASVLLRVPVDLLERVHNALESKPLPTTRQAWMLEALFEKLEREKHP